MTISPTRKSVIMLTAITAGLGFAALTSAATQAAEKPAIEVITHAGAGGGTDVNSRMMMLRGRRTLKQDMVDIDLHGRPRHYHEQGQNQAQGRGFGTAGPRHQ